MVSAAARATMQAESIASCANHSSGHPVTRSRGVSCRRCRAASACSSYLRATSTAVIHAHARGQTQRGVCGHAPQHNEDVPSVMRRGTKGSTCAWTQRGRQWYGVLSSAARPGSSAAWQERTAEAAFHARNVFRDQHQQRGKLCRHTTTRYWLKACVRSTRATPPHALTITPACPHSSVWPSRGRT